MSISPTVRKMILIMLVAGFIFSAIGLIASMHVEVISPIPFTLGVFVSTALNIIKVIWLERIVSATVKLEDEKAAARFVRLHYMLRLLFTALVLFGGAFLPFIDLWGLVIGLFTYHPAKYALGVFIKNDDIEII